MNKKVKRPRFLKGLLKKHEFIKEIVFNNNKTIDVNFYKKDSFKPDYLINPNHFFNHGGYNTIIKSESMAESLNPLDLDSKYNPKDFKTAIESKLISETFGNIETGGLDLMKIMVFANLLINAILLYFLLNQGGVI